MFKPRLFTPKHTFKSVVKELVTGLENGTIVLREPVSQVAIKLSKRHEDGREDMVVTFGLLRWENGFLAGLAQKECEMSST